MAIELYRVKHKVLRHSLLIPTQTCFRNYIQEQLIFLTDLIRDALNFAFG